MHLCWGNYEGPHNHDIALREILPTVLQARPSALSFEAANPRHAHEWNVWRDIALPDDKVVIPGVLDTTTNYVEHPELVAQRIKRYTRTVGKERVIAGADCGFGSMFEAGGVDTRIAWAKLAALVEGAAIASGELW
jgi:5-methyltetrahydropteroyltriglutamate--homocysteine methyltransferase